MGYRDYPPETGDGQHVVFDFVDHTQSQGLKERVGALRASGGGNAEDVAGGLQVSASLLLAAKPG